MKSMLTRTKKYVRPKARNGILKKRNTIFTNIFLHDVIKNIVCSIIAMIIGGLLITNIIERRATKLLFTNKLKDISVKVNNELYKEALNDILVIKTDIPINVEKNALIEFYYHEGICSYNMSQNGQQQEYFLQTAIIAFLKGLELTGGYKSDFDFSSTNSKYLAEDIFAVQKYRLQQHKLLLGLGNSFLKLSNIRNQIRNANQAIKLYELSLSILDINNDRENHATIENQKALSYWQIAVKLSNRDEKKKTLDLALATFENVLLLIKHDNNLDKKGDALNNKGLIYITYSEIIEDDNNKKAELLHQAIANFNECLKYRNFNYDSTKYGKVLNNLGVCYKMLAMYNINPEENVKKAIDYFSISSKARPKNKDLIGHYLVQENMAHCDLILSEYVINKESYINEALVKLNEITETITAHEYPETYERILNYYCEAHQKLAELGIDYEENINKAKDYTNLLNEISNAKTSDIGDA